MALGGGRREGSFGGEWCDRFLSGVPAGHHRLLPTCCCLGLHPTVESSESAIEVPCARSSTRAMAKSSCCICCHVSVDRSFSLPGPQHPQLQKVLFGHNILEAFYRCWQTAFPALRTIIPVSGLWILSNGASVMEHTTDSLLILDMGLDHSWLHLLIGNGG